MRKPINLSPKTLIAALLALGGLGVGAVLWSAAQPVKTAEDAGATAISGFVFADAAARPPVAAFVNAEGARVTLGDFEGRAVLVNFWATWCAPCVRELPALDRLQAQLGGPDFEVVAVNIDAGGGRDVTQFLEDLSIAHLDLYTDPRLGFAFDAGIGNVVPVTILYGPDGREIGRKLGPEEWDRGEVKAFLIRQAGIGAAASAHDAARAVDAMAPVSAGK